VECVWEGLVFDLPFVSYFSLNEMKQLSSIVKRKILLKMFVPVMYSTALLICCHKGFFFSDDILAGIGAHISA
jgi:hypothetical protein